MLHANLKVMLHAMAISNVTSGVTEIKIWGSRMGDIVRERCSYPNQEQMED